MIASLGMYDMPHARAAHDRLWVGIRQHLGSGPANLSRSGDLWDHWQSPDLLLSQTCGLPFRAQLHANVTLVGTPDYGLPGCPTGYYNSVFLVRSDNPAQSLNDLQHPRLAYNDPLSQSGWAAPCAHLKSRALPFEPGPRTGAHVASAQAVADNDAGLTALDALTWAMIRRENPGLAQQLRIIDQTEPTPGLPYITSLTRDPAPLAYAIAQAIAELDDDDRGILHLKGLVHIPSSEYLALSIPPPP